MGHRASIGDAVMIEIENRYTKMVHIKNEIQILLEQLLLHTLDVHVK